jgi:hypothetical protein
MEPPRLPDCFLTLRRLLEARLGKACSREYIQVLRLLEPFPLEVVSHAVEDALWLVVSENWPLPPNYRMVGNSESSRIATSFQA